MKFSAALVLLLVAVAHAEIASRIREPPHANKTALMARFILNEANYTSIATISVRSNTLNYPYASLLSLSDGPLKNGSGVPYVFITPLDAVGQDLKKNESATLMVSLAQSNWCKYKNYDPMDPRCARVTFSGKMKKIEKDNPEYATAKAAIYGRHPWLSHMPEDHSFYFAKLDIETICVLDTFGGPAYPTPAEYYSANDEALGK